MFGVNVTTIGILFSIMCKIFLINWFNNSQTVLKCELANSEKKRNAIKLNCFGYSALVGK
jgi:hypothetical protein